MLNTFFRVVFGHQINIMHGKGKTDIKFSKRLNKKSIISHIDITPKVF